MATKKNKKNSSAFVKGRYDITHAESVSLMKLAQADNRTEKKTFVELLIRKFINGEICEYYNEISKKLNAQ